MGRPQTMLDVRGLCANYGRIPILSDIDFSAAKGEVGNGHCLFPELPFLTAPPAFITQCV